VLGFELLPQYGGLPERTLGELTHGVPAAASATRCHPRRGTLRRACLWHRSLANHATSGATLAGPKTSNSPGATSRPKVAAVPGVASVVNRVRASGAMAFAVTPYFIISASVMIAIRATAALHAP